MTTLTRPLNRQEVLFYFWMAALLWLGIALVAVIIWAMASVSGTRLTRLGLVADFPPAPNLIICRLKCRGNPLRRYIW